MAYIETTSGIMIPAPDNDSCNLTIATLVDSGRSTDGRFIGQVIGDDKLKLECSWKYLSQEDYQKILKIFDRSQGGAFVNNFKIFDPRVNKFVVKEMYVSDRTARPFNPDPNWNPQGWLDISLSLVEV